MTELDLNPVRDATGSEVTALDVPVGVTLAGTDRSIGVSGGTEESADD